MTGRELIAELSKHDLDLDVRFSGESDDVIESVTVEQRWSSPDEFAVYLRAY